MPTVPYRLSSKRGAEQHVKQRLVSGSCIASVNIGSWVEPAYAQRTEAVLEAAYKLCAEARRMDADEAFAASNPIYAHGSPDRLAK